MYELRKLKLYSANIIGISKIVIYKVMKHYLLAYSAKCSGLFKCSCYWSNSEQCSVLVFLIVESKTAQKIEEKQSYCGF